MKDNDETNATQALYRMAHDLRNPIGGIYSLTGILIGEGGLTPEQTDMLTLIRETAAHSLELVNGLLKKDVADKGPEKLPVDMNLVLGRAVKLLQHLAKEKHQDLKLIRCKEGCVIDMNEADIIRVLDNLIYNAIKFSPEGGKIRIETIEQPDDLEVAVHDNGIGIPENLQADLFKNLGGNRRMGTSGERSLGMGLRICRQIITAHKGKLWFERQPEGGTTFAFSLPKHNKPAI